MDLYLPIAQMSVQWLVILGMGFGVGFLSGVFGIGGGFLLTPLLIFYGIPPGVAVATTASQVSASTFSGVLAHWRKRAVDLKMGCVMLAGGLLGTGIGVYLFAVLRRMGQSEFSVSASYVILLGSVGAIMLNESARALMAVNEGKRPGGGRPGRHRWIHRLPCKMRFRQSRLYISAIPPVLLGFVVGVLSAIMGVGGAFLMVPVMIYVLRMPTNVVVGTSMFQVLFVTAAATILHAIDNHTVDIALAFALIAGGVFGVQYGVRVGSRLRGEQLRFFLALLVLAVASRLFYEMVAVPADLYSVTMGTP
ncbi:MAG: sulfite exporter TauE/SafE family protein [Alphaproteobacteria bacterium]|nr:sulfite exporter TauE/SafE family protein [Alphaproteobacteria bacterium]